MLVSSALKICLQSSLSQDHRDPQHLVAEGGKGVTPAQILNKEKQGQDACPGSHSRRLANVVKSPKMVWESKTSPSLQGRPEL